MTSEIKGKAAKGVSWSLLETIFASISRFVIGVILARILMPADFGLIAATSVFLAIADVLVNNGLGHAFIQKEDSNEKDANTIFFSNLVISIVLYVLLYLSAPYIADFYNLEKLNLIIKVLGLIILINAFNIIQIAIIRKELQFKKKAIIVVISTFSSGVVGVVLAKLGFGVWSLVIQQLLNRLFITISLYFVSSWRISLIFHKEIFLQLFNFGAWLFLANLSRRVFDNIYIMSFTRLYPINQVGYYSKSDQLATLISIQLAWAINAVSFPVLSKLKNEKLRIYNTTILFMKYTILFLTPLLLVLYIVADPFVVLMFTDKWIGMVPILQMMCLLSVFIPVFDSASQSLLAIGKSKLIFNLGIVKNVLRIVSIISLYKFGVVTVLIGELLINVFMLMLILMFTNRFFDLSLKKLFREIKWVILASILMVLVGVIIIKISRNNWIQLISTTLSMFLVYIGLLVLFQKKLIVELKNIVLLVIRK